MKFLLLSSTILLSATGAFARPDADGEEPPPGEELAIREVTRRIAAQVKAAAGRDGRAFRDAHRKTHGCVSAEFRVPGGLPAELRQGLFSEPASYPAVVRFSNGSGEAKDDREGDGRGMAVKVLGVRGERNLREPDDETGSQDFLMINHPVFFVRNAADYVGFQKAVEGGTASLLFWLFTPLRAFHEGRIARAIRGKEMVNPLDSTYWSMTASKLGGSQMKFSVTPCAGQGFHSPSGSAERLRENLTATLANGDACFLFRVQLRRNPSTMPVEDPSIEWSEADSPFVSVARIMIPAQSPRADEACEALSFNPWNGLAAMRPLGGISRVRREVYQAISRFRHDFNRQRREEPASN